jgi:hypothetical protein
MYVALWPRQHLFSVRLYDARSRLTFQHTQLRSIKSSKFARVKHSITEKQGYCIGHVAD